MTGNPELTIRRYFQESTAATGEGTRYECDDGSVWHDLQPFEKAAGYRVGEHIITHQEGMGGSDSPQKKASTKRPKRRVNKPPGSQASWLWTS